LYTLEGGDDDVYGVDPLGLGIKLAKGLPLELNNLQLLVFEKL